MISVVLYQDRNYKINSRIKNGINAIKHYFEKNKNYKFNFVEYNNFKLVKADYAIMWNIYTNSKNNTIYRKKIRDYQKENKDKLIIIELGFIKRKYYYSMGYNSISNFGSYPKFPDNNIRLKKLNLKYDFKIDYKHNSDKHILFCLQLINDSQVSNINYNDWVYNTLKRIRLYTKRKIFVRRHPLDISRNFKSSNFNKISNVEVSYKSLEEDLTNCHCVVAYNSTVLLDAVIKSVPILAGHKSSIVYEIAENMIENIEDLKKFKEKQIFECFKKISYKQWTKKEIMKGLPFRYLIE